MFSGIVEEMGEVLSLNAKGQIEIRANRILEDLKIGDSVAVNGCCLTATAVKEASFGATLVPETKRCIASITPGMPVNLERALPYGARVSGHLVQGHVDGVGEIQRKTLLSEGSFEVAVTVPPSLLRYVVQKGSIAVDGVSLTVVRVDENSFSFALIPHTAQVTVLGGKEVGDSVNLEADLLAKYVVGPEKVRAPREKFAVPREEQIFQRRPYS